MNYLRNKFYNLLGISLIALGTVSCEMSAMEDPIVSDHMENNKTKSINKESGANLRVGENISYEETFEGSNPFSTAHGLEVGADYSVTFVTRPGSSDNKSARVELRDNDPIVKGSRRAEVTIVKGENGDIGQDTWYAFELYVPKDYIDEEDDEVINQWHQNGNASASIRIKNGKFLWRFYIDGQKIDTDLGTIQKDTWNSIVVHMVHSYGSDGVTQVWINDKKLIDQKGRNINNDPLPKWKIGIYKSDWADGKTTTNRRVLYFDNVRVGNENATYEGMKSGFGNSSSPEPQPEPTAETSPVIELESNSVPSLSASSSDLVSGISSLTFVNAENDTDVYNLTDGGTLNLTEQGTYKINIRANLSALSIGSVKFELTGTKSFSYIDNTAPYALFGDDANGNYYYGPGLSEGKYSLKVTTYSGSKGTGSVIGSKIVNFSINNSTSISEPQPEPISQPTLSPKIQTSSIEQNPGSGISSLTFVNAQYETDIFPLSDGTSLSLNEQGTHKVSVRANLSSSSIQSVKFELSGTKSHSYIDDAEPHALFGDDSKGNYYYGKGLSEGNYRLKVTTYSGSKGSGTEIGSRVVNFTINK